MEAEKTYQNKVARTIQQKRTGEGALEFADNRLSNQGKYVANAIIQCIRGNKREAMKLARKRTAQILNCGVDQISRRVASGNNGMFAISGSTNKPQVSSKTNTKWENMLKTHHVQKEENWDIDNCAESHLWLLLVDKHIIPKTISIVVGQYTKKNKIRGDRPCKNCRQWVYKEFKSVTGHM